MIHSNFDGDAVPRQLLSRRLVPLFVPLLGALLTGCDKLYPGFFWPNSTLSIKTPVNVLIMGDSQSYRFATEGGIKPLYTRYPKVNIINCGVPGSHMGEWDSGVPDWQNCIALAKSKKIDLVIVFLGTNDTGYLYSLPYSQMFTDLLNRIKAAWKPSRVFYAQVGDNNSGLVYPYWQYVQDEEASVNVSGCTMISTTGLATEPLPDGVHLTPESFNVVGQRIAASL